MLHRVTLLSNIAVMHCFYIVGWPGCWWRWSASKNCYWEQNWTTGERCVNNEHFMAISSFIVLLTVTCFLRSTSSWALRSYLSLWEFAIGLQLSPRHIIPICQWPCYLSGARGVLVTKTWFLTLMCMRQEGWPRFESGLPSGMQSYWSRMSTAPLEWKSPMLSNPLQ